jgi:hypothetical protein
VINMADDVRRPGWPARLAAAVAGRLLTSGLADAGVRPAVANPAAPGYGPVVSARPSWYWSECGRCGIQTRPGMPCTGCGWLLGAVTPEEIEAAGVAVADAEMAGSWAATRWHAAHGGQG